MSPRRIKLQDPPRYEIPAARCVVANCTDSPRDGALVCFIHARALQKLAEEAGR